MMIIMNSPKAIITSARKVPSLEGAVLRALARPATDAAIASAPAPARVASTRAGKPRAAAAAAPPPAPGPEVLKKMARQARTLREHLAKAGLTHVETVRLRPQGDIDRRLIVEVSPDPEDSRAILLRVRPATARPLPVAAAPTLLTTQEAADRLNVSRPYVVQLVDAGRFKDVVRTQAGHRRIPAAEVERVHREMRSIRRAALDDIDEATRDLRERELVAAKRKPKRRWIPGRDASG